MRELIFVPLRAARVVVAGMTAAIIERFASLEPWFVRAGRSMARRSRFEGSVYWFTQEALLRRLRRSGHRYREVTIRNLAVYVDVTDSSGRFPFFYGYPYRKAVIDAVITALKPGDVFLDVGAHIGYFSTVAGRLVGPSGRVIAFEPHDVSRAELQAMVARNEVDRTVEIVPLAVAEREADVTLYATSANAGHSTLEPELSPVRSLVAFHPATVVRATSLDAWLARRPELASRVRCIRIDVEGAESRVLRGMTRALLAAGVTIICETTIGTEADVMLERAGFRRHRIERGTTTHATFLYVRPGRAPG
jgi:FkbM family methyltransferase